MVIAILASSLVYADSYMYLGLKAGISTKEDTDKVLGVPLKEIVKDIYYDYSPEGHGVRRISVTFYKDTQILQAINLYLKEGYQKRQFKKWFDLKEPTKEMIDNNGNLIEYYVPEGIALHFNGSTDRDRVGVISYFDRAMLEMQKSDSTKTSEPSFSYQGKKRPYLGIAISGHEGFGVKVYKVMRDSPAQKAGIQVNDIIVEMGSVKFYMKRMDPKYFLGILSQMPVDRPIRFLIKRDGRPMVYYIQPTIVEESKILSIQKKVTEEFDYFQNNKSVKKGPINKSISGSDKPSSSNSERRGDKEAIEKLIDIGKIIIEEIDKFDRDE